MSTALLSYTLKSWTCLYFPLLDWTSWKPSRRLLWRSLPALRKILRFWGTWRRMQWCVVFLLCHLLECPFQINGVFFGLLLGFLGCTVAETEFFLQPAEAKVCIYQLSNLLTGPLVVEVHLKVVWHLHLVFIDSLCIPWGPLNWDLGGTLHGKLCMMGMHFERSRSGMGCTSPLYRDQRRWYSSV